MLSTIFGKTADLLDKRFLVGLLLPSLGFITAVGALVVTAGSWAAVRELARTVPNPERWLIVASAAAAVLLFAVLIGTQVDRLVGWWEGYWRPHWLCKPGIWVEQRRYGRLDDDDTSDSTRILREFPSSTNDFLPTRLGNALLAAENYSRERYGLDSVLFWPRQYLLLPDAVRTIVDDGRRAIDQFVVVATLSAVTAVIAAAMGMNGQLSGAVWIPSALGAALLSFLTYRSAVSAAIAFGDLVRSVYDLHRRDLLNALGVASPQTPDEERRLWTALGQYLFRGATDTGDETLIRYLPSSKAE